MTFAVVISGFACLSGCGDFGSIVPQDVFTTMVTVPRTPIDTRCSAFVTEHINRSGNSLFLHVVSDRVYPHGGYVLAGSVTRSGVVFSITLDSIWSPSGRSGPASPAEGEFELGNLSPGFYPLTFALNGETVHGLLRLAADALSVSLQRNTMLSIRFPQMRRVPRNIIWGILDVPSMQTLHLIRNFFDSLAYVGGRHHWLQVGEYWYFRIEPEGRIEVALSRESDYYHHFVLSFDPDTTVLRGLVKRFAQRYPDSLMIRVYGGRGEVFLSKQLRLEP